MGGVIGSIFERIYIWLLTRNEMESISLRQLFARKYQLEVGLYSYGCFDRFRFPARTRIGRYCSAARTSRVVDANHPTSALTTHPYLYDPRYGVVSRSAIDPQWIVIEDDVWLGQNCVIMPGCKHIGRGAIIGAGAIVTHDVPAYAIVTGVPASVKRYRFSAEVIAAIESTRWWELDKAELTSRIRRGEATFLDVAALTPAEITALFH